jgi:hypothetical protein
VKKFIKAIFPEIYPAAKGIPDSSVMLFISSRRVECVALMSRAES